jgi:hypothetical protein
MTRYRKRAMPVMPMMIFVPTDELRGPNRDAIRRLRGERANT